MKKVVIAVVVICLICLSACSVFGGKLIGKDAALEIALADAGIEKNIAIDIDIELDSDKYNKWYEVEFDFGSCEYDYRIQAETGEILSSSTK